jgi:hypothetical protein
MLVIEAGTFRLQSAKPLLAQLKISEAITLRFVFMLLLSYDPLQFPTPEKEAVK